MITTLQDGGRRLERHRPRQPIHVPFHCLREASARARNASRLLRIPEFPRFSPGLLPVRFPVTGLLVWVAELSCSPSTTHVIDMQAGLCIVATQMPLGGGWGVGSSGHLIVLGVELRLGLRLIGTASVLIVFFMADLLVSKTFVPMLGNLFGPRTVTIVTLVTRRVPDRRRTHKRPYDQRLDSSCPCALDVKRQIPSSLCYYVLAVHLLTHTILLPYAALRRVYPPLLHPAES